MALEPSRRKTIFEVQREQRWRIWLLFALLLLLVYAAVWVACLVVTSSVYIVIPDSGVFSVVLDWRNTGVIVAAALAFSLVYWYVARIGARQRLLRAMHCRSLDPHDRYHQRLANIVDEMRIASGAPRIECVTVATLGMNAFAFSDLHGAGVIGVTEGALARLSRPQLQAVVAHEFAHILSGAVVTSTVSCLLFGIYSELGDRLEAASSQDGSPWAMLGLTAVMLRAWLAVVQVASRVTSSALSRERELEADVAAARYTRDPLSLAQALRMIGRHPGGGGYIPEGLAPLCIRASEGDGDAGGAFRAWQRTHPPLGLRVNRLLALAHVAPDEFERQADQAAERFDEREHAARQPADAAGRAGALAALGVPAAGAPATTSAAAGSPPAAPRATPGLAATCPSCGDALRPTDYEGIPLRVCRTCGGRLASSDQVRRIAARREVSFSDEQQHLADLLVAQGDDLRRAARLARGRAGVRLVACPQCGTTMMRRHYSYEHTVEVDFCNLCDLYWFEKDELEALQILLERQTT